jgi:hypothetical protein
MTHNKPNLLLVKFSPITAIILFIFAAAKWLSPMQFLGQINFLFRSRSELKQEEIDSKNFTMRRAYAIEMYLIAWIIIESVLVCVSCLWHLSIWFAYIFGILVGSRIIEIIQVTVNASLFDALNGRPDDRVAFRARMIVLAGINFIELCLCFGIIYAIDYSSLKGAGKAVTAFYFSIITQLTIGYGDVTPTGWLRVIAAIQGLISILFVLLVFSRFIASLPKVIGILDCGDQEKERGEKKTLK